MKKLAIIGSGDSANAIIAANCGWVANAEDVDWLAEYMLKVMNTSSAELNRLGENGREYCLHNFSKKINLDKLVDCVIND